MTNRCIYDCQYCVNRRSNDLPRTAFTPRELAAGREKTMQILEEGLKEPLTFSCYRHEDAWLLDLRERVNRAIMQYTAEK